MIKSRWYQTEAEQSIFDYFATKEGNPVLALPTASGKSIVIANFIKRVLYNWPNQRIIVATHVKELVQQNYNKMLAVWPEAPAGIYSAGLKQKDINRAITFGGIQSMAKRPHIFGHVDLIIADECHLISGKDNSNYGKFINCLKLINPAIKIIGFSATHWRSGLGLITDGTIFTDICYDLTTIESFQRLISESYLSLLIPKQTKVQIDTNAIKIKNGEYDKNSSEIVVDKITYKACQEIMNEGYQRKSWLIFASGIKNAQHIAHTITSMGIEARAVHSKMPDEERDEVLRDFKDLSLRCVVNYGVLTTGFDHPALDLIAVLRPTTSSSLWVQMLGRGMRPSPDTCKENCLVLDFAGNTARLGPINDPVIPRKKGDKPGVAPVRICDVCLAYNHAAARVCISCGTEFTFQSKLTTQASTQALIKMEDEPVVQAFNVQNVTYDRYEKTGSPPMIKVSYWCNIKLFNEYVCLQHTGFALAQAKDWWRSVLPGEPPLRTDDALIHLSKARVPRQIMVQTNLKYPKITARIF